MSRKILLVCGIVASLLYGVMIGAIKYEGYSLISQVPSELTAIGAPTRSLWLPLGAIYTVLMAAFGWGVWTSGRRNRTVRIVGGLILAYASWIAASSRTSIAWRSSWRVRSRHGSRARARRITR